MYVSQTRHFSILTNHVYSCKRKKEEISLSPMTKALIPTEMSKGQIDHTKNGLQTVRLHSDYGST